ncbi:MAG: phosphoribosylformylglycinamidine synthase subunit PurL [Saprospiraceae bacterium]|nr:phosphoribosylformylglycinamidine synthase subunit PurL [Saprospiraceae bacterium]
MSVANVETAQKLGLTEEEFYKINDILGRAPNFTELSIYSVMWSEHCSYKNSITYLKKLPRKGSRLLVEAGEENAGLVDIGDGIACAFKIESHNHPSAIEPYQGAATGVGGIHRDIFTMGARPIAALNSLRFGEIQLNHTQRLMKGVVKGIGNYGNAFGVPTVGGEVYFNSCYNQNILVNAMSVGLVEIGKTVSAVADGPGNPVFIVGSATGKDGIHGATFASADLTEDSAEDLPAVQVGDPFQEKLLLEASLEAISTGQIVGMQDMGAAGITCSTSEMSAKSGTGMDIWLDKVPTRQKNMQPFEILLSESQERMLVVCKKGGEEQLLRVFEKWDLECIQIGEVNDTGRLKYFHHDELVADVPAESLVLGGGAPVYQRSFKEPAYLEKVRTFDASAVKLPADLKQVAKELMKHPDIANKKWIYEQYDKMVRTGTMTSVEASDAAIVRIKNSEKALALTVDCNSNYVYLNPETGGMIAVAECARNISCSGGIPVAITNCLNFGNPYNPEVYWQFVHALQGMGKACQKFDTPVTGGNVSFYNQSVSKDGTIPVYPTPVIGMLGILENQNLKTGIAFKNQGDLIYLLGDIQNDISYSTYLSKIHGIQFAPVPHFDLEKEFQLHKNIQGLIRNQLVRSAHDLSEGGLFVALAESCFSPAQLGFSIHLPQGIRSDIALFSEDQGRILVSVAPDKKNEFETYLLQNSQQFLLLGTVEPGVFEIDGEHFGTVGEFFEIYSTAIENYLN